MNRIHRNTQRGQVLILNILVFLTISLFIMIFVMIPITGNNRSLNTLRDQKREFVVAQSAIYEVLYRLNRGMNIPSEWVFELGDETIEVTLSGTSTERMGMFNFGEDGERELNVTFVENASTTLWEVARWQE